jgi:serine/threonine protein kinase
LKAFPINSDDVEKLDSSNHKFDENKIAEKKKILEEDMMKWKDSQKKSPHIVNYIDHWYDDENGFFHNVIEYCPGGDLAKKISDKISQNSQFTEQVFFFLFMYSINIKYNLKEIRSYGAQLAEAVNALHRFILLLSNIIFIYSK